MLCHQNVCCLSDKCDSIREVFIHDRIISNDLYTMKDIIGTFDRSVTDLARQNDCIK